MINRASVPMWGKAGQSAGPPKSAGKKVIAGGIAIPAARIRFYLHKEFRAAEIGILATQTFRAAEIGNSSTQTFGALFLRNH